MQKAIAQGYRLGWNHGNARRPKIQIEPPGWRRIILEISIPPFQHQYIRYFPRLAIAAISPRPCIGGRFGSAQMVNISQQRYKEGKGISLSFTFASLSISAYVFPWYSKIGSHPAVHVLVGVLYRYFKLRWSLTEIRWTSWSHNDTLQSWNVRTLLYFWPCFFFLYLTSVLPWNRIGSVPGPRQNANVHTASAVLSSNESTILFKPS